VNKRIIKNVPHRLETVFFSQPLYFVTFNTWQRAKLLANEHVFNAFMEYAQKNAIAGRAIGRFVIMPDHIHLFLRMKEEFKLSDFVRLLKHRLTKELYSIGFNGKVWQPGFFDHLMRSSESYSEKWQYVYGNPVRKGLVLNSEEWKWQGEVVVIDRVGDAER